MLGRFLLVFFLSASTILGSSSPWEQEEKRLQHVALIGNSCSEMMVNLMRYGLNLGYTAIKGAPIKTDVFDDSPAAWALLNLPSHTRLTDQFETMHAYYCDAVAMIRPNKFRKDLEQGLPMADAQKIQGSFRFLEGYYLPLCLKDLAMFTMLTGKHLSMEDYFEHALVILHYARFLNLDAYEEWRQATESIHHTEGFKQLDSIFEHVHAHYCLILRVVWEEHFKRKTIHSNDTRDHFEKMSACIFPFVSGRNDQIPHPSQCLESIKEFREIYNEFIHPQQVDDAPPPEGNHAQRKAWKHMEKKVMRHAQATDRRLREREKRRPPSIKDREPAPAVSAPERPATARPAKPTIPAAQAQVDYLTLWSQTRPTTPSVRKTRRDETAASSSVPPAFVESSAPKSLCQTPIPDHAYQAYTDFMNKSHGATFEELDTLCTLLGVTLEIKDSTSHVKLSWQGRVTGSFRPHGHQKENSYGQASTAHLKRFFRDTCGFVIPKDKQD